MEAIFQSELRAQRNEEMRITVPDDIVGPRSIAEWYTDEHLTTALEYYTHARKQSRDLEHVILAKKFYECVLRNKEEHDMGPSRKRLKALDSNMKMGRTVGKVTDYLYLTPEGDRRDGTSTPIDTGEDRLNQALQVLIRGQRDTNERFDRMERSISDLRTNTNIRFDSVEGNVGELRRQFGDLRRQFSNLLIQQVSSSRMSKNKFKAAGGVPGTSSAYYPIANDDNEYPDEQGLEPLASLEQIDALHSERVNEYLIFYGLFTGGLLHDRKKRLMSYIGVNYEPVFGIPL